MDNKLYKLMDWPAIEEIVYSESSQPCSILGGHLVKEGYLIQVFRPDAVSVSVSVSERKRAIQLEKVDDAGFFAALIPIKKNVKYVLNIEDKNGHITRLRDPYSLADLISQKLYSTSSQQELNTMHITFLVIRCAKKTAFQVCFLEHGHLMRYE